MRTPRVAVIGAGIGGLVGAALLAHRGLQVELFEAAGAPGGKMREVAIGDLRVDAGPTVLTMPWVFEEIFAAAGASLADHVKLEPLQTLARHAWSDGGRLDLCADPEASVAAIRQFAGAGEAEGFRAFLQRARAVYETLEGPFLKGSRPNPISLSARVGLSRLPDLWRISPFTTLWSALGEHFRDPRLRQLFGRYATYCGSSPFRAPATLMLIAHVEQAGVWRVAGGMHRLARSLADLASSRGAAIHYGRRVERIVVERGAVCAVETQDGQRAEADAILFNGDVAALAAGALGPDAARACDDARRAPNSLSALTFALVGRPEGFPLSHHNVFFSDDYRAEFDEILKQRRLPRDPTIYICAQDRPIDGPGPHAPERLFCLVNAPPGSGHGAISVSELDSCEHATFRRLEKMGLSIHSRGAERIRTGPGEFAGMFPASGGALYGRASHGWAASFARAGARARLPGLYLAGGSVHPGPGVPMAALSGRLAAAELAKDLTSRSRSARAATPGGTSMH